MDILKGICVICCENTLVFSGKDKQKFVDLLKEHYFDNNQINDKFLLQFKEKRSKKSICISCAHIIECYVSTRDKFKAIGKSTKKNCSICNSGYNLTNGTTELIKDACTLLHNIKRARNMPRLTLVCLECSFCIISWKKITDLIAKYPMGDKSCSKAIKRSHSVDSSSESEQSEVSVGNKKMKNGKTDTAVNNSTPKKKFLSKKKLKLENELETQLKHLSNVSTQISSKVVSLNNKVIKRVTSDDRMMFDIAHISCKTRNIESLIINKSKKSGSQQVISYDDKLLTTRLRNRKKSASNTGNQQSKNLGPVKNKRIKLIKIKKVPRKSLRNKTEKQSDVIVVSDSDSVASPGRTSKKKTVNSTPVRISLRLAKGQSTRLAKNQKETSKIQKVSKTSKTNQCSSCDMKFVKKYKLQLHELEHESSFKPVVRMQKENKKSNSDSEDKTASDNAEIDDEIIEKQTTENNNVEKDSHSAETNENEKDGEKSEAKKSGNENEILDECVKQVVDDTLSQLEKEIDENLKETPDENQKSSSSQDSETAYSDISDGDKNIDSINKNKNNADNEKELDIQDEKDGEENSTKENNDNSEEQIETSNENSDTKENINEDIENSDTETDEKTQQSEKSDKINEENNSQDTNHSSEKNEDNVNDNDNETNEETNNSNANGADLQECEKQLEENSQGSAEDSSSNNSDKILDNNVIEIHEDKDDVTNGPKSIVIEDDSSNSSNKDEEIEKVVSSGNAEKDKNIDENKSISIEDSPMSNKSEEDNITQNSEDQINDVIESSQIETNDVDFVKDITINESEQNSQSTDKSIDAEDEMEPLHLSPESINSQNSEVNVSNKQKKNADKYEIVENLLQNLGA